MVAQIKGEVFIALSVKYDTFLLMKSTLSYMKAINMKVNFASCPLLANLRRKLVHTVYFSYWRIHQ